jgi:hypothetical protein
MMGRLENKVKVMKHNFIFSLSAYSEPSIVSLFGRLKSEFVVRNISIPK